MNLETNQMPVNMEKIYKLGNNHDLAWKMNKTTSPGDNVGKICLHCAKKRNKILKVHKLQFC